MKQKSIGKKISSLLLIAVGVAILFLGLISIYSLYSMKDLSERSSRQLGQTAAGDAESALEDMAGEKLKELSIEKAAYIEEKFNTVASYVNGIASAAEDIYENSENYPNRDTALPNKESHDLAAQLLWSQRLNNPTEEQLTEIFKLGNLQDLLVQYNANNDMVSSTYLATKSGWMLQADYISYTKYEKGGNLPDYYEADTRQWYQRAYCAAPGEIVYSDVISDINAGGDCIVCAQPVYHNGEVVAVAGIGSYLATIKEAVFNTKVGESGYAFLVDQNGKVIASGVTAGETSASSVSNIDLRNSTNAGLAEYVTEMTEGKSGIGEVELDGRMVYLAYAPLPELGWSFVTVMDVEEVIAPAKKSESTILDLTEGAAKQQSVAIRRTLIIFLITIVIAAVIISFSSITFTQKLTAPIRQLTEDVKKIDGGNLDYQIAIHSGDEMEELALAFNDMTAQLRNYIQNLKKVTMEKERIHAELSVATGIQADMLPEPKSVMAGRTEYSIYAMMHPAKEVGGDFFDCFYTDEDHLVFLVADVSGKGVPAALFMVVAMTLIENRAMTGESPAEVFTAVNAALCRNNKNDMFLTAWMGVLELSSGKLTFVNAGHNSPLLYQEGSYHYLTDRTGFILAGMDDSEYTQKEIQLQPGDAIFLYSDGVTEANDEKARLFGDARLEAFMNDHRKLTPEQICTTLWDELKGFQGKADQFDDITMLSLQYQGSELPVVENTGIPDITRQPDIMEFISQKLENHKVPTAEIRKVLIAADEIYSNICYYSNAKEVTVRCSVTDEKITISFLDDGVPYNPLEKEEPNISEPLEDREQGGLGIHMVRQIMGEVIYDLKDGKNNLIMKKQVEHTKQ